MTAEQHAKEASRLAKLCSGSAIYPYTAQAAQAHALTALALLEVRRAAEVAA